MPDSGKDAFGGRTPLYGYFSARIPVGQQGSIAKKPGGDLEKFDFQALGVHLKAMADGGPQRQESAQVLANWLREEAPLVDNDTLIMGDFNAPPDDPCWEPFATLEKSNSKVKFRAINDPSDFSYLWLANRTTKFTSKIDLSVMSLASESQIGGPAAKVVRWKPIQDVIAKTGDLTNSQAVAVLKEIKATISDHLPVLHRFYLTT